MVDVVRLQRLVAHLEPDYPSHRVSRQQIDVALARSGAMLYENDSAWSTERPRYPRSRGARAEDGDGEHRDGDGRDEAGIGA